MIGTVLGWVTGGQPLAVTDPVFGAPLVPLDDAGRAVEALRTAGRDEPIALLCGSGDVPAAERLVLEAFPVPDAPVAVVPLRLTPTGLRVAAGTLALIGREAGAGGVLRAAREAERAVTCHVVVDRVAGLSEPAVSLAQHLRSWLPGSRFVVRTGPRGRVLTGVAPLASALGSRAAVATSPKPPAWLEDAVRTVCDEREVQVAAGLPPVAPLDTRTWADIATWDDAALAALPAHAAPAVDCAWCGRPSLPEACPFCGFAGGSADLRAAETASVLDPAGLPGAEGASR